jgi:hypothetical protein
VIVFLFLQVLSSEGFLDMSVEDVSEVLQALPSTVMGHREKVRTIRAWVQHKPDARQHYASQVGTSLRFAWGQIVGVGCVCIKKLIRNY